jgi:CelD/BcsL family acetyltransferase involved in cellulose biosynthesis
MRIEPLCVPGAEPPVATAFALALASARPRLALLKLDGLPAGSPWPGLLAESWPARRAPWTRQGAPILAPTLRIGGLVLEEWRGSKSRNFRSGMARDRRRLKERGARFGTAELADLDRSLKALARLHRARVGPRGGSNALDEGGRVEKMLDEAGRTLVPRGRMRLLCVTVAGETISAHLFVTAGGEVAYWMGGFDEAWAKWHPSLVTIVQAIDDGITREEDRVDFGPGEQPYKYRFADGQDELLGWTLIIPRGPLSVPARLQVVSVRLRSWLSKRIPAGLRVRLLRHLS